MFNGGFIYEKRQKHLINSGSLTACDGDQSNTKVLLLYIGLSGIRIKKMEALGTEWEKQAIENLA